MLISTRDRKGVFASQQPLPSQCGRSGFTLIELLVTIAIISLLASILAPSLNRAMELARRAVCCSNLHQMGVGFAAWAKNHQHSLPAGTRQIDWSWGARWPNRAMYHGYWYNQIQGYDRYQGYWRGDGVLADQALIDPSMLYCPSWEHPWMNLGGRDPTIDWAGGYFTDEEAVALGIGHMYSSYRYRCTFGTYQWRPASLAIDPGSSGVLADAFFSPDEASYHHADGFCVSYLDGGAKFVPDPDGLVGYAYGGGDFAHDYWLQERIWQDFFDLK